MPTCPFYRVEPMKSLYKFGDSKKAHHFFHCVYELSSTIALFDFNSSSSKMIKFSRNYIFNFITRCFHSFCYNIVQVGTIFRKLYSLQIAWTVGYKCLTICSSCILMRSETLYNLLSFIAFVSIISLWAKISVVWGW